MLLGELVIRTDDCPIQQRPDGFDGVGVNVATNPLVMAVGDDSVILADSVVRLVLIGVESRIGFDMLIDEVGNDLVGNVRLWTGGKPDLAVTLDKAHDGGLVSGVATTATADGSADVVLVGFDDAGELGTVIGHSGSNPVAQIPTGLSGDAERSGKLRGAHALLRLDQKEGGEKPLPQGERGVLENGSDSDRELIFAGVALKELAGVNSSDFGGLALRADHPIRPTELGKGFDALVFGPKVLDQFRQVHIEEDTARV